MKTIVTHVSPDQDAICGIWLVKRFFPGWKEATIKFVPAGKTLGNKPPDEDPKIIHLDTGLGQFDHHQTSDRSICASSLVFNKIKSKRYSTDKLELEALSRLIEIVRQVDQAEERSWPESTNDRYEFFFESILDGLKTNKKRFTNEKLIEFGTDALEGIFWGMKQKVLAGKILKEGVKFDSPWGKGVAVETDNTFVVSLGQRQGYMVVVKKNKSAGNVRICAHPKSEADLTEVYHQVVQKDPDADWFFHANKKLLLNGSSKNPRMRPTKLKLKEVVKIVKKEEVR